MKTPAILLLLSVLGTSAVYSGPTAATGKQAYVMQRSEDWLLDGDLPVHAMLIHARETSSIDTVAEILGGSKNPPK